MKISDYDLVEKLQKDDIEAFDEIFKRYGHKLFGFALKYLKSKEDAEGLVQDVFLKIWKNRKKLKKESSLKAYLFTIAYHNMCKILRKRMAHIKFLKEPGHENNRKIDPEKQIEYKFTLGKIDLLIARLPEKQRIVFLKSRNEGKSAREIAAEMNLAEGTVDNYISAAMKILRKSITTENFAILLFFEVFMH